MTTIEESIGYIKKEFHDFDKILSEIENGVEIEKANGNEDEHEKTLAKLIDIYTHSIQKTDKTVESLISSYKYEQLGKEVSKFCKENKDDSFETYLLAGLVDRYLNDKLNKPTLDEDSELFREEHIRYLFSVYIGYLQSHDIDEQVKHSLHNFIVLKFADSQFIRRFLSNDYNDIESLMISSPNVKHDKEKANMLAEKNYYKQLNELIDASNCDEMFDGLIREDLMEARKIKKQLEFAALGLQMDDRNIRFGVTDVDMSDYTQDIMRNASDILNKEKKEKQEEELKNTRIIFFRF